jgi:hypothetical protein
MIGSLRDMNARIASYQTLSSNDRVVFAHSPARLFGDPSP